MVRFAKLAKVGALTALLLAPILAHAAPPAPVPPIPDANRYEYFNLTSSTSSVPVNFPVFGDCTDLTVRLNGTPIAFNNGWTCASQAGGSNLSSLPLPITDIVITFSPVLTSGFLEIIGSWHPRDVVQPTAPGINRREFNQTVSTLIAAQRETYGLTNSWAGNSLLGNPVGTRGLNRNFRLQDLPVNQSPDATNDSLLIYDSKTNQLESISPGALALVFGQVNQGAVVCIQTGDCTLPTGLIMPSPVFMGTVKFPFVNAGALVNDPSGNAYSASVFDVTAYPSMQAAFSAASAASGSVHIPCGTYNLSTALTASIAVGRGISIRGDGHECTTLIFSGSDGFDISYGNVFSSLLVSDLTLETTDTNGAHTAISAVNSTPISYSTWTGQHTTVFHNVVMRGGDAYSTGTEYWGKGISETNVSNILIDGGAFWGANQTATATVSAASPAVVKMTNSFAAGQAVSFSTTGALPTGLTAGKIYYVLNPTSSSFNVAASPGGSAINTSGSQSGTQSVTALGLGTSIYAQGLTSPSSYSTVVNVRGFQVFTCGTMFYYGNFLQGVTIAGGTNATYCDYGVNATTSPTGTPDQLNISDSQFNTFVAGIDAVAMNGALVHDNLFIVAGGFGVIGLGNAYSNHHNFYQASSASLSSAGQRAAIDYASGTLVGGDTAGNTIQGFDIPIEVTSTSYAFANIHDNNIQSATGSQLYFINSSAIGVRLSDPSAFSVSSLNSAIPCSNATAGAKATVDDANSPNYGSLLAGGSIEWANALCNPSIGWTAH